MYGRVKDRNVCDIEEKIPREKPSRPERILGNQTMLRTLQREETVPQKIIRILAMRNISVSPEQAKAMAAILEEGREARILNHNRVVYQDRMGRIMTRAKLFSGAGMMGRVSEQFGPLAEGQQMLVDSSALEDTGFELTPVSVSQVIDSASLAEGRKAREDLAAVMKKSASEATEQTGTEYLHMIGHQLGGKDIKANLVAGAHNLNTAMIPVENLAADLARLGYEVEYHVTFWCRNLPLAAGKSVPYVHAVDLQVSVPKLGAETNWTIIEQGEVAGDYKIANQNLQEIKQRAEEFKRRISEPGREEEAEIQEPQGTPGETIEIRFWGMQEEDGYVMDVVEHEVYDEDGYPISREYHWTGTTELERDLMSQRNFPYAKDGIEYLAGYFHVNSSIVKVQKYYDWFM